MTVDSRQSVDSRAVDSRAIIWTGVAIAAALALLTLALRWNTFAAGGSDSSCYLTQAQLFRRGTTHTNQPLISRAPWPRAAWTFTPAGHIPAPARRDAIVPMCPPGLPLVMAVAGTVPKGDFVVVPLCAALAVWLTFVLGRRLDRASTGAAAAVLLACSPVVLFQAVQPMSDVPAMTWWLLASVLAIGSRDGDGRPFAAGLAASMAILTRPNLSPLAGVLLLYVAQAFRPAIAALKRCATFGAGLVPGVALLALLQWRMYGSPLATGYGPAGNLFQAAHVLPNLKLYLRWLAESHTLLLATAVAAPFVMQRRGEAWLGAAIAAATLALYLPYLVFGDWWYVRFLLPAMPWLILFMIITIRYAAQRLVRVAPDAVVAGLVLALGARWIVTAHEGRVFELVDLEHHFVEAGTFAAERLPENAAVLTVRHSGSVNYYSHLPTVSWDTLEPGSLDGTLEFLREQGLQPILLLDRAEEPQFRARFEAASPIGRLDWPPMASVGRTIRVYNPADRARYFTVRNLSADQAVQFPIWGTSATPSARFASSRFSPPSPSSR